MCQTQKQLIGAQRRSLKTLKNKIEDMANLWADVDEFNLNEFLALARQCESVSKNLSPD